MPEVTTIRQALNEMSRHDVSEMHRWQMLALALEFIMALDGPNSESEMDRDMSEYLRRRKQ